VWTRDVQILDAGFVREMLDGWAALPPGLGIW